MQFELPEVTKVAFTNVNVRPEFHGEEHVRAIDIALSIEGSNELLERIEPGLLRHHYTNHAATEGQEALPEMLSALPNLRFPKLPTSCRYAKDEKPRGYRLEIDHGLGDRNVVLDDCVRGSLSYDTQEGGTVKIHMVLQYNGEQLQDDATLGKLSALAVHGSGHVIVSAPLEPVLVRGKGWRSGKADAPAATDGGAPLLESGDDEPEPGLGHNDSDDIGDEFAEGSPEAALLDSVQTEAEAEAEADQFPAEKPKRGRGKKAAGEVAHVQAAEA